MNIATCPKCRAQYDVSKILPGSRFHCSKCSEIIAVTGDGPPAIEPPSDETQVRSVDPRLSVGREVVFGDYRVTGKIGVGGMATVYKAVHVTNGSTVAIKVLKPEVSLKNPQWVDRFIREARIAYQIKHPNIMHVLKAGMKDEDVYVIMEYLEGESVAEILRREHKFDQERSLDIMIQVARALVEAARHTIVHRDIKPENIMVLKDGTVKLTDLGLAKEVEEDSTVTSGLTTGFMTIGTPHYISPEQILDAKRVGPEADQYSLGATWYHMVTGETPFSGDSAIDLMNKHINERLVSPRKRDAGICKKINGCIKRLMEKKPEDRFPDAQALLDRLDEIKRTGLSDQAPVKKSPQSVKTKKHPKTQSEHHDVGEILAQREVKQQRRQKKIMVAGGAALGVLAAIIIAVLLFGGDSAKGRPTAVVTPSTAPVSEKTSVPERPDPPRPNVTTGTPAAGTDPFKDFDQFDKYELFVGKNQINPLFSISAASPDGYAIEHAPPLTLQAVRANVTATVALNDAVLCDKFEIILDLEVKNGGRFSLLAARKDGSNLRLLLDYPANTYTLFDGETQVTRGRLPKPLNYPSAFLRFRCARDEYVELLQDGEKVFTVGAVPRAGKQPTRPAVSVSEVGNAISFRRFSLRLFQHEDYLNNFRALVNFKPERNFEPDVNTVTPERLWANSATGFIYPLDSRNWGVQTSEHYKLTIKDGLKYLKSKNKSGKFDISPGYDYQVGEMELELEALAERRGKFIVYKTAYVGETLTTIALEVSDKEVRLRRINGDCDGTPEPRLLIRYEINPKKSVYVNMKAKGEWCFIVIDKKRHILNFPNIGAVSFLRFRLAATNEVVGIKTLRFKKAGVGFSEQEEQLVRREIKSGLVRQVEDHIAHKRFKEAREVLEKAKKAGVSSDVLNNLMKKLPK